MAARKKSGDVEAVESAGYGKTASTARPAPSVAPALTELLDRSGVVYFRWDFTTGALLDVSEGVRGLIGYTRADLLGDPRLAERITHPEFARKLPALVLQWSSERPDHIQFEGQYLHRDGRELWLQVSGIPEYAQTGELVGVQALAQDVTPIVLARRAAEEGRQLYIQLFRNAPLPLILYDPETLLVVDVNAFACATYGIAHPDFCGSFFDERIADEEWPRREERLRSAAGGKPVQIVSRMLHKKADGSAFPVQLVTVSLQQSARSLRLGVVRDLTDTEVAETSLRLMRRAVEVADSGVLLLDGGGRVHFANEAAQVLLTLTLEDLQGQDFGRFLGRSWQAAWRSGLDIAARGGIWRGKMALKNAPRKSHLVELHPVLTMGSGVSHFVALLREGPPPTKA